ncbi:MAG TPA: flagellar hook-basal body complex protein FliE [Xanthobacteraceae bacterium]|nr:flagellar hook-basal body complex protein FliE [Xanthobacteraceae bacterium]
MSTPTIAANAYASVARLTDPAGLAKGGAAAGAANGMGAAGGPSFGALLKDAIGSVEQSSRTSDAQSVAMAAGKANIVDVVTAVSETEAAIDTLVAVRDKVIAAYEEIMKMPI